MDRIVSPRLGTNPSRSPSCERMFISSLAEGIVGILQVPCTILKLTAPDNGTLYALNYSSTHFCVYYIFSVVLGLTISDDLQYGHSATIGCFMQNLAHFQEIKWYRGLEIIARCDGGGCTIANWEKRHYRITRGDNKSIVHIKALRKEDVVKWNCKIALFNCYGTIKQEHLKSGEVICLSVGKWSNLNEIYRPSDIVPFILGSNPALAKPSG